MDYNHPQKLVWTWVLLILVIAAIGGLAWFFFYKNDALSENFQTQTQNNETADWKTFTYDRYEFEYPSNWNVWMTLMSEVPTGCFSQGDSICIYSNGLAFSVNTLPWDENTCKEYWNGVGGPKANLEESKVINGKQFYYEKFEDDDLEIYHAFLNGSCYELAKTISGNENLNKMISTFTFTK